MEKPAKARRRRSIRHLRASTGFHSPPLPCAPYGSAWIDQDQETNMDNLVTSFSQLNCEGNNIDNEFATVGGNQASPKYQKNSTSLSQSFADVAACETSSGAYFEDGLANEIEHEISKISSVPLSCDSFSFSADMPMSVNPVGNHPGACGISSHFDFESISDASCTIHNIEENVQENNEIQIDPNTVECVRRDEIEHMVYFNAQDLEQEYNELSLNFSPVPEEDQSVDCLVGSLNCAFSGSFSSQGDHSDSPRFSQSSSFNNGIMSVLSCQKTSGNVSSMNETQTSTLHFLNKTYDVIPKDLENRSSLISSTPSLASDVNDIMPNVSPNMMSEICINDEQEEHSQNVMDIAKGESRENSNELKINKSNESESNRINSFVNYVNANETATTNSTQETVFVKRIQNALANEAKYSNAQSTVNDREALDLEILNMAVNTNDREKQKKRSKRRSSRKFQLEEFSIAFQHPDEQPSKVVTFASDNDDLRLCSFDILESEKENLLFHDQEVCMENVIKTGDKVVLSDCSNSQNVPKRRSGRKSGRIAIHKKVGKPPPVETDEFVKDSSSSAKIASEYLDADCLASNINEIEVDDLSQNKSKVESNTTGFIEDSEAAIPTDSFEERDPAPTTKILRTKRNRKSWGNLSSSQTARKSQEKELTDEEKSPSCDLDPSDLEQIYKQKKYSPITPRLLETIKEIPCRGVLIGKQKFKRFINFPEDFRPTALKRKSRTKKTIKHFKKGLVLNPVDDEEFRSKLEDIMSDLSKLDD